MWVVSIFWLMLWLPCCKPDGWIHMTLILLLLLRNYFLSNLEVSICQGTFILAFCSCGILQRINTAVFGAWEMIFAEELCHIRPSNRPLTSCLSERLAGYLCEWVAVWLAHLRTASQTDWKCCSSEQWWWSEGATSLCPVRHNCICAGLCQIKHNVWRVFCLAFQND